MSAIGRQSDVQDARGRIPVFIVAAGLIFLLFVGRLFYLQIVEGETLRERSEKNSIRRRVVTATRGMIFDRNGEILVDSRPSFDLYFLPNEARNLELSIRRLSLLLERDEEEIQAVVKRGASRSRYHPVRILTDLTRDDVAKIETHKLSLPGMFVEVGPRRAYLYGTLAAHIIGYLGEIDRNELRTKKFGSYRLGDLVGRGGIEQRYEPFLRGANGGQNIEVDVQGRELGVLHEVPSRPGRAVLLTLNSRLQRKAEELMEGREGAIVALDPRNGDVLALVSAPSFDPSIFVGGVTAERWQKLKENPRTPLHNRAIQGQYAPGSIYKIVTATAALEEAFVTPKTQVFCPGYFKLGKRTYRCWKRDGHGFVNLHDALVQSCDVYFYRIGMGIGVDRLAYYARSFGLARETGVDLAGEQRGLIPTTKWKENRYRDRWRPGDTVSVSIGQGYNLVTPIQMAFAFGAVANGGKLLKPRIVSRVDKIEGGDAREYPPEILGYASASEETVRFIQRALLDAVESAQGTGKAARLEGIPVAGKTGTTQVVSSRFRGEREGRFRDHAWFIGYAPAGAPEIVVAVLVEHGGTGGKVAAPIARALLEEAFVSHPVGPTPPLERAASLFDPVEEAKLMGLNVDRLLKEPRRAPIQPGRAPVSAARVPGEAS